MPDTGLFMIIWSFLSLMDQSPMPKTQFMHMQLLQGFYFILLLFCGGYVCIYLFNYFKVYANAHEKILYTFRTLSVVNNM